MVEKIRAELLKFDKNLSVPGAILRLSDTQFQEIAEKYSLSIHYSADINRSIFVYSIRGNIYALVRLLNMKQPIYHVVLLYSKDVEELAASECVVNCQTTSFNRYINEHEWLKTKIKELCTTKVNECFGNSDLAYSIMNLMNKVTSMKTN